MVPAAVDPSTLTFDPLAGPIPAGSVPASGSRCTRWAPARPSRLGRRPTRTSPTVPASSSASGTSTWVPRPGSPPARSRPGTTTSASRASRAAPRPPRWTSSGTRPITVATSVANGGPTGVQWAESPGVAPDKPTLNSASGAPGGQITATFTAGTFSVPATTGFTVSATPSGGGSTVTASGSGSPITVGGPDRRHDLQRDGRSRPTRSATAPSRTRCRRTPGDFDPPAAPTVSITDPINVANQGNVIVSGTGEVGATANIAGRRRQRGHAGRHHDRSGHRERLLGRRSTSRASTTARSRPPSR